MIPSVYTGSFIHSSFNKYFYISIAKDIELSHWGYGNENNNKYSGYGIFIPIWITKNK